MKTTMRNSIVLAVCLLPSILLNSQTWGWAKDIPSTSNMEGRGIATDNYRNNFVVTNYTGTATYGSTNLVSAGNWDIALSKMDEDGNYIWSIPVCAGSGEDHGTAVACDPAGTEIYVTGYYSGTATFGSTVLTSAGSTDIFIAKYNNAGTLQWAISAGGTGYEESVDIAWAKTTGMGRESFVYITGIFTGTATFGSTPITSPTGQSVFVARYNDGAAFGWVRQGYATYNSVYSSAITADLNNNVYITGKFYSTVNFGSLSLNKTDYDQYVLKYNSSGTEQWIRQGGGSNIDGGKDLRTDVSGNIYVCGEYQTGPATYGSFSLTSTGGMDISIVKYNSSGTEQWATKAASSDDDHAYGLVLDVMGNIFIAGTFEGPNLFMGSVTIVSDATIDGFVSRMNSSGTFDMGISPAASPTYSTILPDDISTSSFGHVFLAGDFNYGLTFGSSTITTTGPREAFVAKLKPGEWPFTDGTSLADEMQNMDTDASGNVYMTGTRGYGAFTSKVNTSGTSVWYNTINASGVGTPYITSEAVISDASGNAYIAGEYTQNVTIGSTALPHAGTWNAIYMAKYSSAGSVQWAVQIGDGLTGNVFVRDLAIDASGNLYATGGFYGNPQFGTGGSAVTLFNSGSNMDVFLAKYDNTGTLLWAVSAVTGSSLEEGYGVALSGSNIFVCGKFGGTANFGSGSVSAVASGTTDMFVAKYNSSGGGLAVVTGGSSVGGDEPMYDIAASGSTIYAVGTYQLSITFGGHSLSSSGGYDGMLAKINATTMGVTWVREVKNSGVAQCRGVDANASSVYIIGHFSGTGTFGDGTPVYMTSAGGDDVFIEKFDANGNYKWVKQIGGISNELGVGAGVDGNDHSYIGGNFQTSININGTNYSSAGSYDYFAQKFAFDDGTFARLAHQEPAGDAVQQSGSQVKVYPNPFSQFTTLEVSPARKGSYSLVLFDITGRVVRMQEGEFGSPIVIERGELEAGIYTWQLSGTDSGTDSGKFIIQ
jgi:hypothetical protein